MLVFLKKKSIYVMLVFLMILAAVCMGFTNKKVQAVMTNTTIKKWPVYSVDTDEKKVAISFDAAWGADKTEKILDILNEFNIKATFFLVGFWVDKYPELVKKIYDSGCDIGNHSVNHLDMTKISKEVAIKEISMVNEKIFNITNCKPCVFRFPYGAYNTTTVEIVESLNMVPIQWSVDTLDWKGIGKEEILKRVKKSINNGGIILFHNNSDHVLDALPLVIEYLKNEGYEMVKMTDLVLLKDYNVDSNGVQHKI